MKIKLTKTTSVVLLGILASISFTQVMASTNSSTNRNPSNINFHVLPVSAGSLDTTFDGDGWATTSFGDGQAFAYDAALQTDGKIIVAGSYSFGNSDFALARYNNDGSLDTNFNLDGLLTTDFGLAEELSAVAIQNDGKIVVGGSKHTAGQTDYDLVLARYNADGSLDTTFDTDGKVTTNLGSNYEYIAEIAIQPADDKIVVVGSKNISINNNNIVVARYNTDGSLDTTFDGDGIFTSSLVSFGSAILIQSDGKILINGLIRLNEDGSLDTGFGTNGYVNANGQIALQADEKIIVARINSSTYNAEISRYNTDGSLDASFGANGLTSTIYGDSYNSIQDIAIQTDGRIVIVGHNRVNSFDFNLLRYTSNGLLDDSFGFDGIEYTDFGSQQLNDDDLANAVIIQPDGNIIAAGYSSVGTGNQYHFALARYIGKLVSVVSINRSSSTNPTSESSVDFTVKFSEAVTGVDTSDFTLTTTISGASINSVSGSGEVYTISVNTGTGDGTIKVDLIDNDSIQDMAGTKLSGIGTGNGNFTTGQRYTILKNAPFITSITRMDTNPTSLATAHFAVTFSEAVSGVDASDFWLNTSSVTEAQITNVIGAESSYIVTVSTGPNDGTLQLVGFDNNSIHDALDFKLGGNFIGDGDYYNGETYTILKSYPVVASITRANTSLTNQASVNFLVTFSSPVTGINAATPFSDFALTTTGEVSGASISAVSESGSVYTVTVATGSGSGTIRLDVVDDDTIINTLGGHLGGSAIGDGNFTSGESYTLDKLNPTVLSIKRASATPNIPSVNFIITFSRIVSGVDIADFSLTPTGITNASIIKVSGTGTTYTVTVNTGSGDGTLRLDFINNDTVIDAITNIANSNFTSGEIYTIDKPDLRAPLLRSPRSSTKLNDATPTFWWSNVADAQTYEIIFATDSAFTTNVHNYTNVLPPYTPPAFADNTYYWRVRANANNQPGVWSPSRTFTIDTTGPSAPILSFPTNGVFTSRTPTFRWSPASTATSYEFQYDDDLGFANPNYTVTVRGTSRKLPAMSNGVYYWRVRAKDAAGNWSDWSTPFTINIVR